MRAVMELLAAYSSWLSRMLLVTPEFITRQACSWESSYAGLTDCRIDSGRMGVDEAAEAIASAWRERGRQA